MARRYLCGFRPQPEYCRKQAARGARRFGVEPTLRGNSGSARVPVSGAGAKVGDPLPRAGICENCAGGCRGRGTSHDASSGSRSSLAPSRPDPRSFRADSDDVSELLCGGAVSFGGSRTGYKHVLAGVEIAGYLRGGAGDRGCRHPFALLPAVGGHFRSPAAR